MALRRNVSIIVPAIVAVVVGLSVLVVGGVLFLTSYRPAYDLSDPDYGPYAATIARLHAAFEQRDPTPDDAIDLAALNKGEWTTACVFGGYRNPLDRMEELGAKIDEADRHRLTEAETRGLRVAPVEEFELLIAYVDLGGRARFVHFEHGIGPRGQGFERCVSKPETRVTFKDTHPD
jgi:hypothetical protein